MTNEEAIRELKIQFVGEYDRQREAKDMAIIALEQEPCQDIKEYYKDIWDCDINHPIYENTVAEIVEKSYISGYVHGVENTAKEFRFELKQEPCEDSISRQAVLDLIVANHTKLNGVNVVMYSPLYKDIKQLPSITPQQNTGHWILSDGYWRCSKCREKALLKFDNFGTRTPEYIHVESKYCPNCGAKMESEL